MKAIVPLFLCLILCGCYSDQKQRLASCQITDINDPPTPTVGMSSESILFVSASHIELCMQSHGYEIVPSVRFPCSVDAQTPADKIASRTFGQAISPICYAPMNIVSRQIFKLERLFGQVN